MVVCSTFDLWTLTLIANEILRQSNSAQQGKNGVDESHSDDLCQKGLQGRREVFVFAVSKKKRQTQGSLYHKAAPCLIFKKVLPSHMPFEHTRQAVHLLECLAKKSWALHHRDKPY